MPTDATDALARTLQALSDGPRRIQMVENDVEGMGSLVWPNEYADLLEAALAAEGYAVGPTREEIEPVTFPCPVCRSPITLRGHFEQAVEAADREAATGESTFVGSKPRSSVAADPRCDYCGWLGWTIRDLDRLTHKHNCPHRNKRYCQTHGRCVIEQAAEAADRCATVIVDGELAWRCILPTGHDEEHDPGPEGWGPLDQAAEAADREAAGVKEPSVRGTLDADPSAAADPLDVEALAVVLWKVVGIRRREVVKQIAAAYAAAKEGE